MKDFHKEMANFSDYLLENSSVVLSNLIVGTVGTIGVPILSNSIMLYKQHRFERNVIEFMNKIVENQSILENKLKTFERDKLNFLTDSLLPITFDYIVNEKQIEKIKYYFNGFKNLIMSDLTIFEINNNLDTESLLVLYWDILKNMTFLDIVLFRKIIERNYDNIGINNIKHQEINSDDMLQITWNYSFIKLEKLGVIIRPKTWGELDGECEYTTIMSEVKLTAIGEKFSGFIFR